MSRLDVPRYFANITGLGRLVDYYPMRNQKMNRWGTLLLAIITLAAAAFILVFGLLDTYDRYYKNGPAVILKTIALPASGAALLALIGIVAGVAAYRSWNKGASVFEGGLAYSDLGGIRAWRWDDIASLQIEIIRRQISAQIGSTHHAYILTNTKGKRILLDETLERIEQLGGIIRDQVTPRLMNRYSAAFQRGHAVHFGPITLSKEAGIRVGKRDYPWTGFKHTAVAQGLLYLNFGDGEVVSLPTAEIPNLEVLLALLERPGIG